MAGLTGFPVVVRCPVQWGEMDAFLHVNNVVYLRWFETGRAAYFDRTGLWAQTAPTGIAPIFHSVTCRYRAPLTYPDEVEIGVRVKELGTDRFVVEHAVFSTKLGRIAAEGDGVVVSYHYGRAEKAPLPDAWRRAIEAVEGKHFREVRDG